MDGVSGGKGAIFGKGRLIILQPENGGMRSIEKKKTFETTRPTKNPPQDRRYTRYSVVVFAEERQLTYLLTKLYPA